MSLYSRRSAPTNSSVRVSKLRIFRAASLSLEAPTDAHRYVGSMGSALSAGPFPEIIITEREGVGDSTEKCAARRTPKNKTLAMGRISFLGLFLAGFTGRSLPRLKLDAVIQVRGVRRSNSTPKFYKVVAPLMLSLLNRRDRPGVINGPLGCFRYVRCDLILAIIHCRAIMTLID